MKTIDEELFAKLMRFNRTIRKGMMAQGQMGNRQPMPPMGQEGMPPEFGHGCYRHGMELGGPGMHGPCAGGYPGRRPPLFRESILRIILDTPEGLRQKEIAEKMRINPSSTSELIDKLEDDGYLERKPDQSDKRATLLFLTEKGKARAMEVEDERNEKISVLFKKLTKEEKEQLLNLLNKMLPEEE